MPPPRTVDVPAHRYPAWRERFEASNPDGPQRIVDVQEPLPVPVAVLLVRRGGYAVALADGTGLLTHKVGTRHVQSRTAAGGWSQQRFARRRANQADALVSAVRDHLVRLLDAESLTPRSLARGGDRSLVAEVLDDPRLRCLDGLPARDYPNLPDPRRAVLDDVVARAAAYEITIQDGPPA